MFEFVKYTSVMTFIYSAQDKQYKNCLTLPVLRLLTSKAQGRRCAMCLVIFQIFASFDIGRISQQQHES